MPGTQVFVAAAQGTPLHHLVLVASRAYVHRSQTVTNGKTVFNQLPTSGPITRTAD